MYTFGGFCASTLWGWYNNFKIEKTLFQMYFTISIGTIFGSIVSEKNPFSQFDLNLPIKTNWLIILSGHITDTIIIKIM